MYNLKTQNILHFDNKLEKKRNSTFQHGPCILKFMHINIVIFFLPYPILKHNVHKFKAFKFFHNYTLTQTVHLHSLWNKVAQYKTFLVSYSSRL